GASGEGDGASGETGDGAGDGAGGANDGSGSTDASPPESGGSQDTMPTVTAERALFDRSTGGPMQDRVQQAALGLADAKGGSGGGRTGTRGGRGGGRGSGSKTKKPVSREQAIRFHFLYGPPDDFSKDPGSYRFWLLDTQDTVAEEGWTRIPPNPRPTTGFYDSESEITFFRSPESEFVLQFKLFPFHYDNISEADMDQAALGAGKIIRVPKGYKGDIVIDLMFAAHTETIQVPAGQTLRDVLVQKGINVYRVAKV